MSISVYQRSSIGTALLCAERRLLLSCLNSYGMNLFIKPSQRLNCKSSHTLSSMANLQTWFIGSLVSAGQCSQHRPKYRTPSNLFIRASQQQDFHENSAPSFSITNTKSSVPEQRAPNTTGRIKSQAELLALVDDFEVLYGDEPLLPELPSRYQPANGPSLTVSEKEEDQWPPPGSMASDPEIKAKLKNLAQAMNEKQKVPAELYRLYNELPFPRVSHMPKFMRHRFLRHLSVVEKKDEQSMLRYFAVLDDMKISSIPLSGPEWNSALSFAARYVEKSSEVEVESALRLWREMELVAKLKGNHVTFNILFDVAVRAGKFVLAEMVYREMITRGLEFDRYHFVSLIKYNGLRRNGDAVRTTYKTLVKAGEIVDRRVLNTMISALIDCGEESAAENIYIRMKQDHWEALGEDPPPSRNWFEERELDRSLTGLARLPKEHVRRLAVEKTLVLSPNIHTFRILFHHFAVTLGQFEKVVNFVEDMKSFMMPLDERIFLSLLRASEKHGGIRYTSWTKGRLEDIWSALLQAVDNKIDGLVLSKRLVSCGLSAFGKCSDSNRTVKAWEEAKHRWDASDDEVDDVIRNVLRPILNKSDRSSATHNDWLLRAL